ncbi:hypothetical protein TorRG33x02_301280 [Trema orientale]|uniref:Uncharacterized protein n=1 Tax=Trema orientale TaxID=63057 RepID=A0A2P5C1M0_TREOI|nr:hypothetical protein TorRG33x02_301280 [Trema orientale]
MGVPCSPKHGHKITLMLICFGLKGAPNSSIFFSTLVFKLQWPKGGVHGHLIASGILLVVRI